MLFKNFYTKILLFTLSIFLSANLIAQKKSIGFSPFTYNHQSCDKESALIVYNYVVQAFDATQRFIVLDRLFGTTVVSDEQELLKEEIFMDGEIVVEKGKLEGAEWMVSGHITAATYSKNTNTDSEGNTTISYSPNISFFLRIYDVVTGEVVASEIITPGGRVGITDEEAKQSIISKGFWQQLVSGGNGVSVGNSSTPQEAMSRGMSGLLPVLTEFIRDNFPFELENFDIEVDEYGNEKIIAYAPKQMGVSIDQVFDVIHLIDKTIGPITVTSKEKQGELKIIELAGQVIYLGPKNKGQGYLINYIEENRDKIILKESSSRATLMDKNPFEADPEKRARRKEMREERKEKKKKNN